MQSLIDSNLQEGEDSFIKEGESDPGQYPLLLVGNPRRQLGPPNQAQTNIYSSKHPHHSGTHPYSGKDPPFNVIGSSCLNMHHYSCLCKYYLILPNVNLPVGDDSVSDDAMESCDMSVFLECLSSTTSFSNLFVADCAVFSGAPSFSNLRRRLLSRRRSALFSSVGAESTFVSTL